MADNDHFVDEVNDELRRDQAYKTVYKYRYVIGAVIIGVLGFVALREYLVSASRADGEAEYKLLAEAQSSADYEDAGDESLLILFEKARLQHQEGDVEGAIATLNAALSGSQHPEALRELARLRLAGLDKNLDLGALTNPDAPFKPVAEFVGVERNLEAGESEAAIAGLEALLEERNLGRLSGTAEALILSLGGEIPEIEFDYTETETEADEDGGDL